MSDRLETSRAATLVERFLKIPPAPDPPAGTPGSTRTFRGAPGFYRYQLLVWAGSQLAAAFGLFIGFVFLAEIPPFPYDFVLTLLEYFGVLTYLAALPVTFLMVHLDYQLRWYIVTDRSLRIREGLVHISEKTMSFSNIQNISVKQGPVQRLLGIADVEVRTAGGGSSAPGQEGKTTNMHLGYFRGVDNAEEIRDAILDRVRRLRDSGLGDPDSHDHGHDAPVGTPEAVDAARLLLDEVRALRHALAAEG